MAVIFSVCCSEELAKEVKEKKLSPSLCFQRGIIQELNDDSPLPEGQKIDKESLLSKKERQVRALQATLLNVQDELNDLRSKHGIN